MAIQDILVHMDSGKSCKARLEAAIQIAKDHEAHLTGLYVIPNAALAVYMGVHMSADLIQMQEQRLADTAYEVEVKFNAATKREGISTEWRARQGDAVEIITDHAHYADLVIIGQHDPNTAVIDEIPDHVVMSAGRPVLIIPYNFAGATIGKTVMAGWDGGQRATRALHDALPILHKADKVVVLCVDPEARPNTKTHLPGVDIAHHMARHGIQAEARHITNNERINMSGMGVGDQLLSRAADMGADLMVIGAYGHARWREIVLGGVTRQLMESMPVPVLMSH